MRRASAISCRSLLSLVGLTACGAAPAPHVAALMGAPAPKVEVAFCAETRSSSRGQACLGPLTAEEQGHRDFSVRIDYRDGLPVRVLRLNGRGTPVPNDGGCVEYRYTFDAGVVAEAVGYRSDGSVCAHTHYRERGSRADYTDAFGRPDLDAEHDYVGTRLDFGADGLASRERPVAADGSAAHIALAAELRFERDARHFEKRTCYFDEQGKPTRSNAGVHCWTYETDRFGNALLQRAWDENGEATSTYDGIHEIRREADRFGNLVRKWNLNLQGEIVAPTPGVCPVWSGLRDEHGFQIGADCRDARGERTRFDTGNASWRSTPDAHGFSREVRHFDVDGNPTPMDGGYARQEMDRDELGYITERRYFRADGTPGQEKGVPVVRYVYDARHLEVKRSNFNERGEPLSYKGCVTTETEYDEFRQVVRQACRGFQNELTASSEKVATTLSSYDARGLLTETRYTDPTGKLVDSRGGFARAVYEYDARGAELRTRHYKADGSELTLKRFSTLWVRPANVDRYFPGLPREQALARIRTARAEVLQGMPFTVALHRFGNGRIRGRRPGDVGYLDLDDVFPAARQALLPLEVGAYSEIIELPYGFVFYQRTE